MASPTASSHRAAREALVTYTAEYEPDANAMTRALLAVLAHNAQIASDPDGTVRVGAATKGVATDARARNSTPV